MSETLKNTLDALEAASEAAETSTDASEVVQETESEEVDVPKGKGKPGAEARIRELNAKAKEYETKLEETRSRAETLQTKLDSLTELLGEKEQDSRVVRRINELYESTPELKDHIEALDRAIKGQPVTKTDDKTVPDTDKALKAIENVRAELKEQQMALAEEVADQKAQALVGQADRVMEGLIGALPGDKYAEADVKVLSEVLENRVNWEAIEANPSVLTKEIEKAFQATVDWYGEPRGALASKTQTSPTQEKDVKATIAEITSKEWGKLKETGKDRFGRSRFEPVVSDADFVKVLGETMRRQGS